MSTPPVADARRVLAGRYRLGKRIGSGGMATILRAEDLQMEREVAVKVLHPHLAHDPEVRRRFRAEARHAGSLSHPGVVAVYDQGESDLPYIVLELVDGPSLREVLSTHGPLTPAQVLAVVQPLCGALAAAHEIGLVHRDIKPENVLVTPEGLPKLADFGIARVMAATSHTATGTFVGSVHYLAPELVGGIEATPASDQYAIGVMVFELLTGRKPLQADTPMAIALRHAHEPIPPASRYAPEVPQAVDDVILRATAHDPAARYPDVATFGQALAQATAAEPAPVTYVEGDGVVKTLILPSDQSPTVALARNRRGHTPSLPMAVPSPAAPRRRRRTGRALAYTLVTLLVLALLGGGGYWLWDQVIAPEASVPLLVGQSREDAFDALQDRGLELDVDGERNHIDAPAGTVIEQRPAEGAPLRQGEAVTVVLSLGPRRVEMPDVLGQPWDDIRGVLRANRFNVHLTRQHHDTQAAGNVIAQLPEPGVTVDEGEEVFVTVSLGIEQVEVPDLDGLDADQARAALEDARLTANITEEYSDEQPEEGQVISQSIRPGRMVDKNSTVDVVVSRGPLTIPTPDVLGLPVEEARALLTEAGLVVSDQSGPVPVLGPFTFGSRGQVERQIPAPDEPIQRGQTVQIFYFT